MVDRITVNVRGAPGPRGLASGPLGAGSVGAEELTTDGDQLADMAYLLGLGGAREPLIPTVALTFDYWPDAYDKAFGYMFSRDLVGTWFVDYRTIDNTASTGPMAPYNLSGNSTDGLGVTTNKLVELKSNGWTVGAYLGGYPVDTNSDGNIDTEWNMPTLLSENRLLLIEYWKTIKTAFRDKGLGEVTSAAPNQRAWDDRLRRLSKGVWPRVRVASQNVPQELPVPDPLYIDKGGVPSLDNGDTSASLNATIDAFLNQEKPGLLQFVIHKVGSNTEPYTVGTPSFIALLDRLASERNAGTLRVVGYDELPGFV